MLNLLNVIREETVTRQRRHSQEGYIRKAAGYMVASGVPINKVGTSGYRKSLLIAAATVAFEDGMQSPIINKSSVGNALTGVGTKDADTQAVKAYADEYQLVFANWKEQAEKSGNPVKWIQDNRPGYRYNTEPDGSVIPKRNDRGDIVVDSVTPYRLSDSEAKMIWDNLQMIVG